MPELVSVVIPTFNRAQLVCAAVESVLAQTHRPIEVIVVDDGSTDTTVEALARYGDRIRVIRQANSGVCVARNAAITASTGEFIAFLDSDDCWRPWKLAVQLAAFDAFPELQLIYTDANVVDRNGSVLHERCLRRFYHMSYGYLPDDALFERTAPLEGRFDAAASDLVGTQLRIGDFSSKIYLGNFFHLSTVMVRRNALDRHGLFDPKVGNAGEDYELFSRLAQAGPVGLIDAPSAACRVGGSDHLSAMRTHTALASLETMRRIEQRAGKKIELRPDIVRSRQRDAALWAGLALFDDDRPRDARPYLARGLALGSRKPRAFVYWALSFLPLSAIRMARGLRRLTKRMLPPPKRRRSQVAPSA